LLIGTNFFFQDSEFRFQREGEMGGYGIEFAGFEKFNIKIP
jgi:hypothetical protein